MANVTISQLPNAGTLAGTELVPIVQNGVTVQTTTGAIALSSGYTGTVTSVAATVPSFLSVTGSPITSSGTLAISYSGTALPVANGGTGSTSTQFVNAATNITGTLPVANGGTGVTTSSGASSVVLRDANQNITVNALNEGFTSVAASGTTITLTASSNRRYTLTGSGGQVITLPNATTLQAGNIYYFDNNQSSGAITVNNNSGTLVVSVPSGGYVSVYLLDNSIAAGSWDRHDAPPSNVSWSTNTFDYVGSITGATWNGTTIAYNRGGTGQSSAFVASGVVYASSTSALATGTALSFDGANMFVSGGNLWQYTPAPTSLSGVTTLTAAQLGTDVINTTGTTYTVTLPLATAIDTRYPAAGTSVGLDFHIVNTASGTITVAVNTGITSVGTLTVATGVSAAFRLRRTATATYILYRIS
jgi:hypothetical protein